jgi:hypothetical protein
MLAYETYKGLYYLWVISFDGIDFQNNAMVGIVQIVSDSVCFFILWNKISEKGSASEP